jgi:DeoR family transcriptional regulator, fructose operon transcriptional repressor
MSRVIGDTRLLPSERQRRIRQLALEHGVLRVSELAERFGVSEMTIRRDLDTLEQHGHVEKTFGGAVLVEQSAHELNYQIRLEQQRPQKDAIAAFAASLVADGDTVAIDASTTGLALATRLAMRRVTVVTNSIDIAHQLRSAECDLIMIGGFLRQAAGSFVGPLALDALKSIRVDHAFFSSKGVLIPDGFLDSDLSEIEVKRQLLASAARVTALVDASKFGKRALGRIAGVGDPTTVVTDDAVDASVVDALREHGATVRVVSVEAA